MTQRYQLWTLFLVGDNLDIKQQHMIKKLVQRAGIPFSRYNFQNVPIEQTERYIYRPIMSNLTCQGSKTMGIWCWAGASCMNIAMDMAYRDPLVSHIVRLDDDDSWDPSHLNNLADGFRFTDNVGFVHTMARGYLTQVHDNGFPYIPGTKGMILRPPYPCGLIIATAGWDKRLVDFRFRGYLEQSAALSKKNRSMDICCNSPNCSKLILPSDADMWERVHNLVSKGIIKAVFNPIVDCTKLENASKLMKLADLYPSGHNKKRIAMLENRTKHASPPLKEIVCGEYEAWVNNTCEHINVTAVKMRDRILDFSRNRQSYLLVVIDIPKTGSMATESLLNNTPGLKRFYPDIHHEEIYFSLLKSRRYPTKFEAPKLLPNLTVFINGHVSFPGYKKVLPKNIPKFYMTQFRDPMNRSFSGLFFYRDVFSNKTLSADYIVDCPLLSGNTQTFYCAGNFLESYLAHKNISSYVDIFRKESGTINYPRMLQQAKSNIAKSFGSIFILEKEQYNQYLRYVMFGEKIILPKVDSRGPGVPRNHFNRTEQETALFKKHTEQDSILYAYVTKLQAEIVRQLQRIVGLQLAL